MSLAKNFHIQPSEIDIMPAWEYEIFMKELNNAVKEDNERQERDMDDPKYRDIKKISEPGYISKIQQSANSKIPTTIPNMGSISMPKL